MLSHRPDEVTTPVLHQKWQNLRDSRSRLTSLLRSGYHLGGTLSETDDYLSTQALRLSVTRVN